MTKQRELLDRFISNPTLETLQALRTSLPSGCPATYMSPGFKWYGIQPEGSGAASVFSCRNCPISGFNFPGGAIEAVSLCGYLESPDSYATPRYYVEKIFKDNPATVLIALVKFRNWLELFEEGDCEQAQ